MGTEDTARHQQVPQVPEPLATRRPTPTSTTQREPILDVLRGFGILGILLVNIAYMRGSDLYALFTGGPGAPTGPADDTLDFLVGWLATGKFISSLALLFGFGAALIVTRARRTGTSGRRLLARRYALLIPLGLAHMVLLFPGDVLFLYGLAGMLLLVFVNVRPRVALWWAGGILAATLLFGLAFAAAETALPAASDDPFESWMEEFFAERQITAIEARTEGGYTDVLAVQAVESLVVQFGALFSLPWVLALFLVGYAIGGSGMLDDLAAHRRLLRRAAILGLGLGLPLSLPLGYAGVLAFGDFGGGAGASVSLAFGSAVAQIVGAPLLSVGYLATLTLLSLRFGASAPLAAVGRTALSAYLLQSFVMLVLFAGLDLYDQVTLAQSLVMAAGVWVLLLVVCPLWLRAFRFGPVEWLWRSLTYRRAQPMRR